MGNKNYLYIFCLIFTLFVFFRTLALAEATRRTTFKVSNMSCVFCIGKIDSKLKMLDGYVGMLANIEKKLVVVDHRSDLTSKQIAVAITSVGCPATTANESEAELDRYISSERSGWRKPADGFLNRVIQYVRMVID